MMGVYGYAKKKDLKASVGKRLQYVETSMFGTEYQENGINTVVGPDAYTKRDWYAQVTVKDGIITKVT